MSKQNSTSYTPQEQEALRRELQANRKSMGNRQYVLLAPRQCEGCREMFQPQRRNQTHHNQACKQTAYRQRRQQKRNTERYLEALRNKQQQKLTVVPCTIDQANAYVKYQHRHHGAIPVARLAFAVADEAGLVRGVAIVGRPCNTHLDDGLTLEVRRVATDGCPNACSFLYGAAWKAARAIGYKRLVTYTLPDEGGASLRAVGWKEIKGCGGDPWKSRKRNRNENPLFLVKKTRWEIATLDYATSRPVVFVTEAPPRMPLASSDPTSASTGFLCYTEMDLFTPIG